MPIAISSVLCWLKLKLAKRLMWKVPAKVYSFGYSLLNNANRLLFEQLYRKVHLNAAT